MIQLVGPEPPTDLLDQFNRLINVIKRSNRGLKIDRIGKAMRSDQTQFGQFKRQTEVFANKSIRRPCQRIDPELDPLWQHGKFARANVHDA